MGVEGSLKMKVRRQGLSEGLGGFLRDPGPLLTLSSL